MQLGRAGRPRTQISLDADTVEADRTIYPATRRGQVGEPTTQTIPHNRHSTASRRYVAQRLRAQPKVVHSAVYVETLQQAKGLHVVRLRIPQVDARRHLREEVRHQDDVTFFRVARCKRANRVVDAKDLVAQDQPWAFTFGRQSAVSLERRAVFAAEFEIVLMFHGGVAWRRCHAVKSIDDDGCDLAVLCQSYPVRATICSAFSFNAGTFRHHAHAWHRRG